MENFRNSENATLRTLFNRRSVRAYLDKPLSQSDIDTIILSAIRAPTAGNMMMYSIIEVKDQDLKNQLVKTCDNQSMIAKAPLVLLFLADMQRWYDFFKMSHVQEFCQENNYSFRTPQESDLMLSACDALIAAQNAVIGAEALGIGSCYVGDIMENYEQHQQMFNLPQWVFPITLLCFGYPKKPEPPQNLRKRIDQQFIHYINQYKNLSDAELHEAFTYMNPQNSYPGEAKNLGQHIFLKKTGSDYAQEMVRSVKKIFDTWLEKK
jgi:nitroreductase